LHGARGRDSSAQQRLLPTHAVPSYARPCCMTLLRCLPLDTSSRAAHAVLAAVVPGAIAQLAAAAPADDTRAPVHADCSTVQRSRQRCSRACRAGPSRCCLAQLADAHLAHRCCSARLLPWRTPQAARRFAPLFRALRLHRTLLAALRSLCCGPACAVPCYARSTLLAHFAIDMSVALQTQQCTCQPFLCSADVDT
jgi:hypothetical protein